MRIRERIEEMLRTGEIAGSDYLVLVREPVMVAGIDTAAEYRDAYTLYAVRRNSRRRWVTVFYVNPRHKELADMLRGWCGHKVSRVLEGLEGAAKRSHVSEELAGGAR